MSDTGRNDEADDTWDSALPLMLSCWHTQELILDLTLADTTATTTEERVIPDKGSLLKEVHNILKGWHHVTFTLGASNVQQT